MNDNVHRPAYFSMRMEWMLSPKKPVPPVSKILFAGSIIKIDFFLFDDQWTVFHLYPDGTDIFA